MFGTFSTFQVNLSIVCYGIGVHKQKMWVQTILIHEIDHMCVCTGTNICVIEPVKWIVNEG